MRFPIFFLLAAAFVSACGPGRKVDDLEADNATQVQPPAPPTGGEPPSELKPCYALKFPERTWPSDVTPLQRAAFQLALDLTGSYEGDIGWENLSNNFDGQGLSMGLLNQTLGTGSLQPLLAEMKNNRASVLKSVLEKNRLGSMVSMLERWEKARAQGLSLAGAEEPYSPLDIEPPGFVGVLASAENESVTWAVQNLYDGSKFKPDWLRELTALSSHASYVDLQIGAGLTLHRKAVAYQKRAGVWDLRTYLLMFDFLTQNGSVQEDVWTEYAAHVAAHPQASATDRLKALLDFRLKKVKPQYVEDVRSRKLAIIDGAATVHGRARRIEKEYCVNRLTPLPQ